MALIFITTCNHFVFFPMQVKNERINKEIKGRERRTSSNTNLQVLVAEVSVSDQGGETANMRYESQIDTRKVNTPLFIH